MQSRDRWPLRRTLAWCSLVLGVLLVCAAVGYFIRGGSEHAPEDERHGPFWDKYQRVQFGMSQKEVEAILGPAKMEDHWSSMGGNTWCYWEEIGQHIGVHFAGVGRKDREDGADGKTFYGKHGSEPDSWRVVDEQKLTGKGD